MSTTSWDSLVKLASDFSTLTDAISGAIDLYDTIKGDSGVSDVVSQISNLATITQQGLQAVVSAVDNETYTTQWTAAIAPLAAASTVYNTLGPQLSTLSTGTGAVPFIVTDREVPLVQWCETGADTTSTTSLANGALTQLYNQISSIYAMFNSAEASSAAPALLTIWSNVCQAGQSAKMNGFSGQTQYTLTFSFLQQVYATVGVLTYIYEAALAAYLKVPGNDNPYKFQPVRPYVATAFGNYNSPTSVWGIFNQAMNAMIASGNPTQQVGLCATTGDCGAGQGNNQPAYATFSAEGDNEECFYLTQVVAPAGSYLGGFQILQEPNGATEYMYLQALPVSVGANLALTQGPWLRAPAPTALYAQGSEAALYAMAAGKGPAQVGSFFVSGGGSLYVSGAYCVPPVQTATDCFPVITGLAFVINNQSSIATSRLCLQVQYSTLDLHDPTNPTITAPQWVSPTPQPTQFFSTQGWDNAPVNIQSIDCRIAGTSDYFPASNIALTQTNPNATSPSMISIGLAVQNALPLHTLSWLQPDKAFGPSQSSTTSSTAATTTGTTTTAAMATPAAATSASA